MSTVFWQNGEPNCLVDKLYLYHESALDQKLWSAYGKKLASGYCGRANWGAGFSVDSLSVVTERAVSGGNAGTPSTFAGFCTGKASVSDYDKCDKRDICYMSPPAANSNEVDVILVPGGVCGPKGWRPMIEFRETSGGKLEAAYRESCTCGANSDVVLKGTGPATGGSFRPLFDLYRVQDRLAGNDDASRKGYNTPTTPAAALLLSPLLLLLSWLFVL